MRIISWDEDAIRRIQDDPRALGYGLCFWMASNVLPAALWDAGAGLHKWGSAYLLVSVIAQLVFSAFAIAAQLGLIRLFAFHFLGASGSFVQILRPLSLASVVWLVNSCLCWCPSLLAGERSPQASQSPACRRADWRGLP